MQVISSSSREALSSSLKREVKGKLPVVMLKHYAALDSVFISEGFVGERDIYRGV